MSRMHISKEESRPFTPGDILHRSLRVPPSLQRRKQDFPPCRPARETPQEMTQQLPNESSVVQKLSCDLRHVAIAVAMRGVRATQKTKRPTSPPNPSLRASTAYGEPNPAFSSKTSR